MSLTTFHSSDHWLVPGEVEVTAVGDFTSGPRTVVSCEALEKVVFLYVLKGRVRVRLSDAGDMTLGVGEVLVVFPGRMLTIELTGKTNRLMAVALTGRGAVRAALGLGYWDLLRATAQYEGNYMLEIIERFHASPERGHDPAILSQIEHLLTTVWLRLRHGGGKGEMFDAANLINRRICAGESLTTDEAAATVGVSRSKLNAIFLGGMGIRPGEYLSRTVAHLAQSELFFTKEPVAKIAVRLGFSSSSAFAVFFRRRTGRTPAAFRRNPIAIA